MSGEAMNPNIPSASEAIDPEDRFLKELDERIVEALERKPETAIPADFAARVTSQVPARRPVRLRPVLSRPTHYGHLAMVVSLVVLAVAFAVMAFSNFGRTTTGQAIEWVFYAQLLTLALWLGLRQILTR